MPGGGHGLACRRGQRRVVLRRVVSLDAAAGHLTLRFPADCFPRSVMISYSTCCPSLSVLSPAFSTAEMWTNTSLPPHKSVDTLRGYVRDADIFKDHAGAGLL